MTGFKTYVRDLRLGDWELWNGRTVTVTSIESEKLAVGMVRICYLYDGRERQDMYPLNSTWDVRRIQFVIDEVPL